MPAAEALLDSLGQKQIYQCLIESKGGEKKSKGGQRGNRKKQAEAKQPWKKPRDFPGGPGARLHAPSARGLGLNSWSGN